MADDDTGERALPYTRREWLKLTGIGATVSATGFAGCLGNNGGGGGTTTGAGGDETTTEETTTTEADTGTTEGDDTSMGDSTTMGDDTSMGDGTTEGDGTSMDDGTTGGGNGTDAGNQSGGMPRDMPDIDEEFVLPAISNLEQANFNIWGLTPNLFYPNRLLWDGLTHYSTESGDWYPQLATDWDFDTDNGVVSMSIREGVEWHNGTAYTAEHAADHFRLDRVMGGAVWDFATEVSAPDDRTLEFQIEPAAESIMKPVFLGNTWAHWLWTHPEFHSEFIDRAKDVTTGTAMSSLRSDLQQFKISPQEAIDGGIGHGPVELTQATNSELVLEPYDNYPVGWVEGASLNWNGVRMKSFGSGESAFHRAAVANNIDGFTGTTPPQVRNKMDDHWQILQVPQYGHQGILFSPDSKWGKDNAESRALRQAIAYAYDPSQYVKIFGEEMLRFPTPNNVTGLNTPQANNWLGDVLGDYTNYGNGETTWSMPEKAASKMQEAGYEQNGSGKWVDSESGDRLSTEVVYPVNFSANVPSYQNVVEQLNDFGIKAQGAGEDSTNMVSTTLPNMDFELAISGTSLGPHPLNAYRSSIGDVSQPDTTRWNNQISEVDVPWPPGNPDNDTKTVSIDDRITQMGNTTDSEEVQKLVEELAWIQNQWVHAIQCNTGVRGNYVATNNWDYGVDRDDPRLISEQPWTQLMRTGDMRGSSN